MALLVRTWPALLAIMTIIYAILSAGCTITESSQNMDFSYSPGFANSSGITTYGTVQFSDSTMWMLYNPATSPIEGSNLIGRAAYYRPITFTPDSSFNTSFTFQFIVTGTGDKLDSPSGMTFFISPDGRVPPDNSGGRYLGLIDGTHLTSDHPSDTGNPFFAVEFDSTEDYEPSYGLDDPSNSHIGIDINSVESIAFADSSANTTSTGFYPELYLCRNSTFAAWISYTASSKIIQVWMTNITTTSNSSSAAIFDPPNNSRILNLKQDLYSSVFSRNSTWYVGFTAANYKVENPPARIAILSWHFSVDHTGSITTINNPNGANPNLKLIIPLAVLGLIVLLVAFSTVYFVQRRIIAHNRRTDYNTTDNRCDIDLKSVANLERYSYQELRDSANGFNPSISLIGEGGSSKVYKGTLKDGSIVAIKRLKDKLGKESELASELSIINQVKHRNLLQLQGWSFDKGEALLVYKFMSNGSLDSYIFGKNKGTLDGDTRLRILQGVANAIEYLHSGLGECILHRDVKAANVLLTEGFEPALGDFGLARLIKHDSIVTATMVGTPGYVAPEVFMTGTITDKADVYSFGILMLEVACGSSAINRVAEPKLYVYLVEWVSRMMEANNVLDVIDPSILKMSSSTHHTEQQWRNILHLALLCCQTSPNSRPPMRNVSQYIHDIYLDPFIPPASYKSLDSLNKDDEYNEYLSFLSKQSIMINHFSSSNPSLLSSSSTSISSSTNVSCGPIPR